MDILENYGSSVATEPGEARAELECALGHLPSVQLERSVAQLPLVQLVRALRHSPSVQFERSAREVLHAVADLGIACNDTSLAQLESARAQWEREKAERVSRLLERADELLEDLGPHGPQTTRLLVGLQQRIDRVQGGRREKPWAAAAAAVSQMLRGAEIENCPIDDAPPFSWPALMRFLMLEGCLPDAYSPPTGATALECGAWWEENSERTRRAVNRNGVLHGMEMGHAPRTKWDDEQLQDEVEEMCRWFARGHEELALQEGDRGGAAKFEIVK